VPPLQIRGSVAGWDLLYFTPKTFKPDPHKSQAWNRGAYLVEGLGHCGACHMPANVLGAAERGRALQGNGIDNWWAPNLVNLGKKGGRGWSADDIVRFLKAGRNEHATAGGSMSEVIENSTQHLTAPDLKAIATYLTDLRGSTKTPATPSVSQASADVMASGKAIYAATCSACHAADGSGVKGMIPALAGNSIVRASNPVGVLHVILAGGKGNVTKTAPSRVAMPPFGWKLTDAEVAAVASYVRASWGNAASRVSVDAAANLRGTLTAQTPYPPRLR
jgi:mono/diheme cytochrome c family protein